MTSMWIYFVASATATLPATDSFVICSHALDGDAPPAAYLPVDELDGLGSLYELTGEPQSDEMAIPVRPKFVIFNGEAGFGIGLFEAPNGEFVDGFARMDCEESELYGPPDSGAGPSEEDNALDQEGAEG